MANCITEYEGSDVPQMEKLDYYLEISKIVYKSGDVYINFRANQKDGSVYRYKNVPRSVYEAFLTSSSKTEYYLDKIEGQYPSQCIDYFR